MNWNLFVTELVAGITHGSVYALIIPIMFLTAMLGCGLLGVMIERFAYRRLRAAPRIAPLITALGVSFFLENAAQLVLGAQQQQYNPYGWLKGPIALHGWKLPSGVLLSYAHALILG